MCKYCKIILATLGFEPERCGLQAGVILLYHRRHWEIPTLQLLAIKLTERVSEPWLEL